MSIRSDCLKQWGKNHGYTIDGSGEKWYWKFNTDASVHGSGTKSQVAKDIYNHITDYVWVEYQRQYAQEKAQEDIHLDSPE